MNATLRWIAPTHNTDGTPIKDKITYLIYSFGTQALPEPVVTDQTHYTFPVRRHIAQCFYVKAQVDGRTGPNSPLACIKF